MKLGPQNIVLGHGDSSLPNLLSGTFGPGYDEGYRPGTFGSLAIKQKKADKILRGGIGFGSGHSRGCVDVASFLPCGLKAGQVTEGDEIDLIDPATLAQSKGKVVYSRRVQAVRFQLLTRHGGLLVCSDSAPLPVREGPDRHPAAMMGQETVVMMDGESFWDQIVGLRDVGPGWVQHITMEGPLRYFLAGEFDGAYLAHHNAKRPERPEPGT